MTSSHHVILSEAYKHALSEVERESKILRSTCGLPQDDIKLSLLA